jgi:hypothetical protein
MATATMKSLKAGLNFTLKMGIFCPNNGEGLTFSRKNTNLIVICRKRMHGDFNQKSFFFSFNLFLSYQGFFSFVKENS